MDNNISQIIPYHPDTNQSQPSDTTVTDQEAQPSAFVQLPAEIKLHILQYLSDRSLRITARVFRELHAFSNIILDDRKINYLYFKLKNKCLNGQAITRSEMIAAMPGIESLPISPDNTRPWFNQKIMNNNGSVTKDLLEMSQIYIEFFQKTLISQAESQNAHTREQVSRLMKNIFGDLLQKHPGSSNNELARVCVMFGFIYEALLANRIDLLSVVAENKENLLNLNWSRHKVHFTEENLKGLKAKLQPETFKLFTQILGSIAKSSQ